MNTAVTDTKPLTTLTPAGVRRRRNFRPSRGVIFACVIGVVIVLALAPAVTCCNPVCFTDSPLNHKGWAIWKTVVIANMERATGGLPPLWPNDIRYGNPPRPVAWTSSVQYFRYLMSSTQYTGDPLLAVPTENIFDDRLVPDLSYELFAGAGVPAASSAAEFDASRCAWHVACIGENSATESPFLISRNVHVEKGQIVKSDERRRVVLDVIAPFERTRAVWCVRGGSAFRVRGWRLTQAKLLPRTNQIEVIGCR